MSPPRFNYNTQNTEYSWICDSLDYFFTARWKSVDTIVITLVFLSFSQTETDPKRIWDHALVMEIHNKLMKQENGRKTYLQNLSKVKIHSSVSWTSYVKAYLITIEPSMGHTSELCNSDSISLRFWLPENQEKVFGHQTCIYTQYHSNPCHQP